MYGFAPDQWIAALIAQPPQILNSPLLKFGAVVVGVIIIVGMVILEIRRQRTRGHPFGPKEGAALARSIVGEVEVAKQGRLQDKQDLKRLELSHPPQSVLATVREWKLPMHAIESFGNEFIKQERDTRRKRIREAHEHGSEAETAIQKLYDENPAGVTPKTPPEIVEQFDSWRSKLSEAAFDGDKAKKELGQADQILRSQISHDLETGRLIAKGFRAPAPSGEIEIPQAEWRILQLDFPNAIAHRKHDGEPAFVGILIGEPQRASTRRVGNPLILPDNIRADFIAWDRQKILTLRQAAQLWAEERPSQGELSQMAEIILDELLNAVAEGRLRHEERVLPPEDSLAGQWRRTGLALGLAIGALTGKEHKAFSDDRITRANLQEYAEAKGERPLFLFPEDR